MKIFRLFFGLIFLTVICCKKESIDFKKDEKNQDFVVNKTLKNDQILSYYYNSNPFDSFGYYHNVGLEFTLNQGLGLNSHDSLKAAEVDNFLFTQFNFGEF